MSYLDNIRLVFTGKFQADVSTVNNDVRHFDNATFDPGFQKFMAGPSLERLVESDRLGRVPADQLPRRDGRLWRRQHGDRR